MGSWPDLYPITPDGPVNAEWWQDFRAGLAKGYTLLQLRVRNEPRPVLRGIVEQAAQLCRDAGCDLMLNGPLEWAEEFDLAGIHLPASALMVLESNPFEQEPARKRRWLAASCHSPGELQHAERIGADWVCLSPVRPTSSHPGTPALGLETFRAWTRACRLPVYGLGGLGPGDLDLIRAAGGKGVAGISAFWG